MAHEQPHRESITRTTIVRRIARGARYCIFPLVALLGSAILAVLLVESLVRLFALDYRFIGRGLYYQNTNTESLMPDPDPLIAYRLKPGCVNYHRLGKSITVTINSQSARGPERTREKPPGVYRILCVGGSNVFGFNVNDEETWPARLEAELNRERPGAFEVWNMGASGYVASQMAAVATRAVENIRPDLVIYALSNIGIAPFLWGHPIASYFEKDPVLWDAIFPKTCVLPPAFLDYSVKMCLIRHIHLYRWIAFWVRLLHGCNRQNPDFYEMRSITETRQFFDWARSRTRLCVFVCPGVVNIFRPRLEPYYRGTGLPVFSLEAVGRPVEFRDIHPEPDVLVWYGAEIARWLKENGLVGALEP